MNFRNILYQSETNYLYNISSTNENVILFSIRLFQTIAEL